jgi:hypothetical protein
MPPTPRIRSAVLSVLMDREVTIRYQYRFFLPISSNHCGAVAISKDSPTALPGGVP